MAQRHTLVAIGAAATVAAGLFGPVTAPSSAAEASAARLDSRSGDGSLTASTNRTTDPSGKHCWYEMGTNRSLCAETPDALAVKMYETYGVMLEERPGESLPAQVISPSKKVKQLVKSKRLTRTVSAEAAHPRASTYLLIKGYSEKNYGGYSVNWTQPLSVKPCSYAASYPYGQTEYMRNFNFSDKMRSYQVADGCRLHVYKDTVFRGNIRGPYGNSKSLGILDREVSSMSLRY